MSTLGKADFAAGRLVPALPQYMRRNLGMSVVYPNRALRLAVSAFIDSVVGKMRAELFSAQGVPAIPAALNSLDTISS